MSGRDRIKDKQVREVSAVDGTELLDSAIAETSVPETEAPLITGVLIGELIAMKDDGRTPLVLYPGQVGTAALAARSVVDLHGAHIGSSVVLMFESGDPGRPVVMGVLREADSWSLEERPAEVEVDADGERMIVTAKEQLVLRCGKASITLTKAGKILIEGGYVLSRSLGANRIKGGRCRSTKRDGVRMNLINATKLVAGYTMATDKTGREWLVVVAKGAYAIPDLPDHEPTLLQKQVPLVMSDVFTGEPGFSAPLYEIDFAPRKPRCDVLLNGSCYAPDGRPAPYVPVGLKIGSLAKSFKVVGPRVYKAGLLYCKPGEPQPFTVLPITYDNAYGGVDRTNEDPAKQRWYPLNHAGVGYHPTKRAEELDGMPLPNTEELGNPVSRPDGSYRPMAFGPVGRAWQQRIQWAGTYDQAWLNGKAPFLPDDFDDRYFQAAPEDQQMGFLRGAEQVVLINLTLRGRVAFQLPDLALPVLLRRKDGSRHDGNPVVDTITIEPDLNRFTLVWRAALPLQRNVFEVQQVTVGKI